MRWKIIVVNAAIVAMVGLLTYALLAPSVKEVVSNRAERGREVVLALRSASAQLALDALVVERWLDDQAQQSASVAVFSAGTIEARREAATVQANRIRDAAVADAVFAKMEPSLVVFVDAQGIALGRNGAATMRGDRVGSAYPSLMEAMRETKSASAVWTHRERQEQLFVSYAPVRNSDAVVVGAVVVGTPLSDERLARTSELTSAQWLAFGVARGDRLEVLASNGIKHALLSSLGGPELRLAASSSLRTQGVAIADGPINGHLAGTTAVQGFEAEGAVVIAAVPASLVDDVRRWLGLPIFGVALLGIGMVSVAGVVLGNYISRPVSELEDGLLAVINGESELRFQIEHAELGGLVFRINSLLNAWMGVPEDTTDEDGRPSTPPSAQAFRETLAIDETLAAAESVDPELRKRLAAEEPSAYYRRLFEEYLETKRQLGDPVEEFRFGAFLARIQADEQRMTGKYGRPVRFQVHRRDNAVVLTAIPL